MFEIPIGKTGVKIPLTTLISAIPKAIKALQAKAADNHDEDSPGGVKTTPGEVAEDVAAFCTALAEALLPAVLKQLG